MKNAFLFILILGCILLPWRSHGGTIGVGPSFQPGEEITDGVRLRYKLRVNKLTADSGVKIIFQTRRLYNPKNNGPGSETYLLESNLYNYSVTYKDTGAVPWPPTNAGAANYGQAALWLSIPDYNRHGMVGSRPIDEASKRMFPRVMTGIDNIPGLTKIETISQRDILGQDVSIEYSRGGTFRKPLSGWGVRFDPSVKFKDSDRNKPQPETVPDLPSNTEYRIWTATVSVANKQFGYEFAVPDKFGTHFAPYEIFSIVTEFLDKNPAEVTAGKGDFQAFFWDFKLMREHRSKWLPIRKLKCFYRADPKPNIGWGAKIGEYQKTPVLEISNDGTDTYYKLNQVFEIPEEQH